MQPTVGQVLILDRIFSRMKNSMFGSENSDLCWCLAENMIAIEDTLKAYYTVKNGDDKAKKYREEKDNLIAQGVERDEHGAPIQKEVSPDVFHVAVRDPEHLKSALSSLSSDNPGMDEELERLDKMAANLRGKPADVHLSPLKKSWLSSMSMTPGEIKLLISLDVIEG